MSRSKQPRIAPEGFFALRTPLLPVDELERWSSGLEAPAAGGEADLGERVERDRRRLRARLREIVDRPEVREALYVASPSLVAALESWRRRPEGKKGQRAERALVRYFTRMCSRPTPFGLFSGCSSAALVDSDGPTRIELAARPRYRRSSRPDTEYLFTLCRELCRDPRVRRQLTVRPNSSLYRAAGRLRYAELHLEAGGRAYRRVAVEECPFVRAALERAAGGAVADEVARAVAAADPDGEVDGDEAAAFVDELVASQLLVPDLSPAVTGREPIYELIEQLRRLAGAEAVTGALERLRDRLADLDGRGLGAEPATYETLARELEGLPVAPEPSRLLQVDMSKPLVAAHLGREVREEIERGVGLLRRLCGVPPESALSQFRAAFVERYGDARLVPLVEALDEEVGLGFGADGLGSTDRGPLLDGLGIRRLTGSPSTTNWGAKENLLLHKLEAALREGAGEIEISDEELESFPEAELPPLPDSFRVTGRLAAASQQALERGDFRFWLHTGFGPSGARLLGRFCHGDPELARRVSEQLRAEEAVEPDAVFAEVVHLPEGRIGNVLCRPVLRGYEIPYLGRSGAPAERQIPVNDLDVTVVGDSILLRSRRLGRRVIPRNTTAHNFEFGALPVYRFLCSLQTWGLQPGLYWSWEAFDTLDFLPRVTSGRLVLSRARWRASRAEIAGLEAGGPAERYRAVQEWRRRRRLPRQVLLRESDNELLVDLDNSLSADAFLSVARKRPAVELFEPFPGAGEHPVAGPEGRYLHELVVPYRTLGEIRRSTEVGRPVGPVRRSFPPGSEWLYAKLYAGPATADRVLFEAVEPIARRAVERGAADRWFFLRYTDPSHHLRVRFHGRPEALHREVLPQLEEAVRRQGLVQRFQLDTYEREVERYGGPRGIPLAEQVAYLDSETVSALLRHLTGDGGAEARWRLALAGAARLFDDFGVSSDERLEQMERVRRSLEREFAVGRKPLAHRLRQERRSLEALLAGEAGGDPLVAAGLAELRRRSRRLEPVVAELARLERRGRLALPLAYINLSFVHMFFNRLIRSDARAHELVLYDFLLQLERSRAARARQAQRQPVRAPAVTDG